MVVSVSVSVAVSVATEVSAFDVHADSVTDTSVSFISSSCEWTRASECCKLAISSSAFALKKSLSRLVGVYN